MVVNSFICTMIHFIGFHDLQLVAPIGVHETERILGNSFSIDLQVAVSLPDNDTLQLSETVDYVKLMHIVRLHFTQPAELLENIGRQIMHDVTAEWPGIHGIDLQIRKLHPIVRVQVHDTFVRICTGYFENH